MSASSRTLARRLAFSAVLTGVTLLVVLGLLEAGLRLVGFGESPHFARRVRLATGETIWRENRGCTVPYFSPALARRPQPFRLTADKAPGTYRIFILGSSAAMGDPEPSFSLARVLEVMLRAEWPGQRFEVVNAGITAVNSDLVRGLAADCARLGPDLFIVYEGHNEVIGPFGPAGVFAPFLQSTGAVRFAIWVKGTRTGQLISAAGRALAGRRGAPAEWGGMQMFLRQQIAADDPRLATVRRQFRENLLAIADSARQAGATSLVCTVLSNQRDFAPFLSQHRSGLSPEELARWNHAFATAGAAERAGDHVAAEQAYREALAVDDRFAELAYRLGRLALAGGRDGEARPLLSQARDLDALRFRADSQLNGVIRDLAALGRSDLAVVDLATELGAASPHGIPGDDLLYEHVHLNLRGTCAAARALLPRIAADLKRRGWGANPTGHPTSDDEIRQRLGYTTYEQAMIALSLLGRFRAAPFTDLSDDRARVADWERISARADALLARPDALPALRAVYDGALEQAPGDWVLARNAGAMLVARHEPAEGLPLLQRAVDWIDDDIDTLVPLGLALRALGRTTEAEAVFARARHLAPGYPGLPGPEALPR